MDFVATYGQVVLSAIMLIAISLSYWKLSIKQDAVRDNELKHITQKVDMLNAKVDGLEKRVATIEGEVKRIDGKKVTR